MPDGATADRRVRIYEVGPRDGLQNESPLIGTTDKLRFIELLAAAGLTEIEATSFVRPATIPQLADADEIVQGLDRRDGVRYPVLVPNERGMARAEAAGAQALAVFTAASDAFTRHNIGMTIAESLAAFRPVLDRATSLGWWRRAYVSTAFGCPYTGRIEPAAAIEVGLRLAELGAQEICFGDTIGVAVPDQVEELAGLAIARRPGAGSDRLPLPRHAGNGPGQRGGRPAGGDPDVRRLDRRHRRLPVRAGRGRQPRHRGPRLLPRRLGLGPRRAARRSPRGGPLHRRAARPAARVEGGPGGRLGSSHGRPASALLIASTPWTVPSSC